MTVLAPSLRLSPAAAFERDDMEFRTITTLLHILSSRERLSVENFEVSRELRPRLKLLAALSSLLVRDHEILAIIPKRSSRGTTVYVGSEEEPDFRDNESTKSTSSTTSASSVQESFITRNPRFGDQTGPAVLLDSPIVEVGSDIIHFLLGNWSVVFLLLI